MELIFAKIRSSGSDLRDDTMDGSVVWIATPLALGGINSWRGRVLYVLNTAYRIWKCGGR
jgi:hypothetical protein